MNWITDVWPWLVAMGVLIVFSALFSGSEAALFSLQVRGRRRLARTGAAGQRAAQLLEDPERLLSAILFWNLLINMTYFAIAAIIGARLEADQQTGRSTAIVFTVASLLTIIFFSEMLPKSLAVISPIRLSVLVGAPLTLAVRIVGPILPLVKMANLATRRLVWPSFQGEPEIDLADIERAVELGTDDAVLLQRERLAMSGIVQMAETRVSEVMRPRAQLRSCPASVTRDVLAEGMPPGGYLMVTDHKSRLITAAIGVRVLRPSQMDDLNEASEPVIYSPWSALVSQVWDQMNDQDCSVAVVVNEFGEAIGALSADDILRRVLAPRRGRDDESGGQASIQQIDVDHFRVSGSASLRALVKRLSVEPPQENIATVSGYIQRSNERLPREGDRAVLGRFELCVVEQTGDATWIDVHPFAQQPGDAEGHA